MKFITTKDENGIEELFAFPSRIHHDAMAEMLGHIKNQTHGNWKRVHRTPIAAGFVNASGQCNGRSETLGLDSRPQDSVLFAKQLSKATEST